MKGNLRRAPRAAYSIEGLRRGLAESSGVDDLFQALDPMLGEGGHGIVFAAVEVQAAVFWANPGPIARSRRVCRNRRYDQQLNKPNMS